MKKSTKLVIACSAIAAAVGAATYAGAKLISDAALNREEPKLITKIKGMAAGSDPEGALDSSVKTELKLGAELLRAREAETPTVTARDGVCLTGHWVPHPNPKRVIIAMHGWRSSWTHDFSSISTFWYDTGCSVLYPDQRGQQASGGDYMSFGMLERFDCLDWISWVTEKCGKDIPVYLAGVSMGATSVLMASEFELGENVKGILADCGFTEPDAIWRHVAKNNLHMPYSLQRGMVDGMCRKKLNLSARACSTTQALKKATVPVLFVHGSEDHFVPVEMTYRNYVACTSPKKLLIVPGADHGMSYLVDRKAYQTMVKDFWKTWDK